jgi:VanZ family protein
VSTSDGRRLAVARWLPAIAWMVVIFVLSSISGLRVSEEAQVDRPIRAVAHLASYAFLAGLLLFAVAGLVRPRLRDVGVAFAVAVLYGLSDEIHQAFVPERSGRIEDVVIDTVGAVIGLAVASLILIRWSADRGQGGDDSRAAGGS